LGRNAADGCFSTVPICTFKEGVIMGISAEELLKIPEVIDEINKHRWYESENVGYDVGFDHARDDWLKRYSSLWIDHHLPDGKKGKEVKEKKIKRPRMRKAKSYT